MDMLGLAVIGVDADALVDTAASAVKGVKGAFTKKAEESSPGPPPGEEKKAEEPGFLSRTLVGHLKVWHALAAVAVGGVGVLMLRRRQAS